DGVVCDVFDLPALMAAVAGAHPDVILHQLTDLPDDPRGLPAAMAANNRIRREGTANLLAAAAAAGVRRILVQSVAWELPGEAGAAVAEMERQARAAGAVILRYGRFYGPGTYYTTAPPDPPRIAVASAARATLALLEAPSGVYPVVE
ncbi:MAG: epimerase, partial [Firmicutes bacterium]|nr:epimerase [Bacillota bacterium]